jgi:PAS domain S-box-containing protein
MGTKGDTSGHKKKAKGEKHSKEFVETVLNSMDDAISIIDVRDFKLVGTNQVFNDLYDLNGDEAIGKHCYEITHQRKEPCAPPDDMCPLTETLKTGKFAVFDHIHTRHDGKKEFVEVSASPILDDAGKVVQVVHIARNITGRKQSEQQIKNIIDAAPDVIHVISPQMKIITRNAASKKLFPHIKEGDYCHEALHKREMVCAHCGVTKVFKNAEKQEHESAIKLPNGKKITVYSTSSPIFDEKGNVMAAVEILRDITDRKKSEQQLKDIIDAAPDVIHLISSDMKIITRNAASKKLFPHIKEGDYCHEALHKRDEVCTHCGVTEVFKDRKKHEHESTITLPDGNTIIVYSTSSPIFDENGGVISAVEILRDITDRKKAQQELQESEERFSALFNQASDCIILLDPSQGADPVIVDANISACTMHGYTHEELIGKPMSFLNDPDGAKRVSERVEQMMSGKQLTFEAGHVRKDGLTFPVEVSAQLIHIGGKPYIQAIERDITKRKKTEEVLWKYAKDLETANQLKDLFTDIMRHDLLNHLGIIRNLAEIVLEDNKLDDPEDIQMIMSSARKLEEIVDAASTYAKLESAEHIEWKEMDLNTIIKDAEDTLQPYFEEKHITVEHRPRGRYAVNTISMVEEVFVNLLSNAIKYSGESTLVTVDIEDAHENFRVTVADQGAGVPDEYKEKIFNRLTRRKKEGVKGSGIGLAIVKQIANLHRGSTGVLDNPRGGSIFYFEIPKKEK